MTTMTKSNHQATTADACSKPRRTLRVVIKTLLASCVVIFQVVHIDWNGSGLLVQGGPTDDLSSEVHLLSKERSSSSSSSSRALLNHENVANNGREFARIQEAQLTTKPYVPRKRKRNEKQQQQQGAGDFHLPFVHIVKTRFMQTQAPLVALGRARLELFKSFCLPSIVNQSSQKFIWIIKADPDLDKDLLTDLLTVLSPYPNVYLIADNEKFDSWSDGRDPNQLLQTKVYTGNQTLLEDAIYHAIEGRSRVPILESRLDADDALHVEYFERVQDMAMKRLVGGGQKRSVGGVLGQSNNNKAKWGYWGVQDVMEWHWIGQGHGQGQGKQEQEEYGVLHPHNYKRSPNYVPTPGLTLGVGAGETAPHVTKHSMLKKRIKDLPKKHGCGLANNEDCIQFVTYRSYSYPALRTRCPTSASMMDIDSFTKSQLEKNYNVSPRYWTALKKGFRVDPEQAKSTFHHITTNLRDIAHDAILGQCTASHSCRPEAKKDLERLLTFTMT